MSEQHLHRGSACLLPDSKNGEPMDIDVDPMLGAEEVREEEPARAGPSHPDIPHHWTPMLPDQSMEAVQLNAETVEYQEVYHYFLTTLRGHVFDNVSNIFRVQNKYLWKHYALKRQEMAQDCPDPGQLEKALFHGTKGSNVEVICRRGFDWRLCGQQGTKYGQGCYFARDSKYSHSYSARGRGDTLYMILARVLIGQFIVGHSDYRRPPAVHPGNPNGRLFDSCVDHQPDPSIFVVFDSNQAYPEYVIEYSV